LSIFPFLKSFLYDLYTQGAYHSACEFENGFWAVLFCAFLETGLKTALFKNVYHTFHCSTSTRHHHLADSTILFIARLPLVIIISPTPPSPHIVQMSTSTSQLMLLISAAVAAAAIIIIDYYFTDGSPYYGDGGKARYV
jgi:hypothetical protein